MKEKCYTVYTDNLTCIWGLIETIVGVIGLVKIYRTDDRKIHE